MKIYLFLILFLKSTVVLAQTDTFTFIGQIGFDATKEITRDETRGLVPYNFFLRNYDVKLWINKNPLRVIMTPKEKYYSKDLDKGIEIRIEIQGSKISNPVVEKVNGVIVHKRTKKEYQLKTFEIHKTPTDKENIINQTTIKLDKLIGLSEPEEVTIPVIIDYINRRLDDESDRYDHFPRTVSELNRLKNDSRIEYPLDQQKLIDYYKLHHFIEPFVVENSFLNQEARILNARLNQLSDTISTGKKSRRNIQEIREDYASALEVYKEYQSFYEKLNGYYMQLQSIIFLRTPSQMANDTETDVSSNPTKNAGKIKSLRLAIGVGVSYRSDDNYNVFESSKSTVQFDSISRVNTVLSAGLIWSPFSVKGSPGRFSVGLFADYYISSSIGKITAKLPLGGGGGLGFSGRNFGVLAKVNLNKVRNPTKSFIQNYKGKNQVLDKSLAPLDINNDLLFADKTNTSYGISIFYFL